jgi:RNA polymerase sigma-70 factor (ECF subfamily)
MSDSPTTRPSLLVRIRNARDGPAWSEFVRLYAPLVYGFARRYGLQDADAADVTQEVFRAVMAAAGKLDYDPQRGSFRGWLFTVARNTLRNYLASRQRLGRGSGDTAVQELLAQQPAPEGEDSAFWDRAHERRLFAWAADRVRSEVHASTWKAFWQTAVEGQGPQQVARELGMTVANVYLARSRVMARLKTHVQQWRDEEPGGSP